MEEEIFIKIKKFTVYHSGVDEKKVRQDASIECDLGITGDDAVDFIIAFGRDFNVDVSRFMAADYFNPEGDIILPTIIRFFTGQKKRKQKDLFINHLVKAVIEGRLDEEVINS